MTGQQGDEAMEDLAAAEAVVHAEDDSAASGELRAGDLSAREYAASRNIDDFDRSEIIAAIREVFADGIPFERETATHVVGRALGYGRVGRRIRERVAAELTVAVRRRVLKYEGGLLALDCRRIDDYTRAEQTAALLAAIGRGWIERADAIRAAARYLGFRRTGSAIQAAFKSVIRGRLQTGELEHDGNDLIRKTRGRGDD